MRIFLLGFMGSGKSTIGTQLAQALDYPFFDLDHYIEQTLQKSIPEIFNQEGEMQFRQYETIYLNEIIIKNQKAVIATGGGTPCFNQNMQLMLSNGITIYLKVNTETIYHRIKTTTHTRPLLHHKTDNELKEWIVKTIQEREFYYSQSKFILNADDISVSSIISLLQLQQ